MEGRKFKILVIGLLLNDNAVHPYGTEVYEAQLTRPVDELLNEGFIEEVKEPVKTAAQLKAEKKAADELAAKQEEEAKAEAQRLAEEQAKAAEAEAAKTAEAEAANKAADTAAEGGDSDLNPADLVDQIKKK